MLYFTRGNSLLLFEKENNYAFTGHTSSETTTEIHDFAVKTESAVSVYTYLFREGRSWKTLCCILQGE